MLQDFRLFACVREADNIFMTGSYRETVRGEMIQKCKFI